MKSNPIQNPESRRLPKAAHVCRILNSPKAHPKLRAGYLDQLHKSGALGDMQVSARRFAAREKTVDSIERMDLPNIIRFAHEIKDRECIETWQGEKALGGETALRTIKALDQKYHLGLNDADIKDLRLWVNPERLNTLEISYRKGDNPKVQTIFIHDTSIHKMIDPSHPDHTIYRDSYSSAIKPQDTP